MRLPPASGYSPQNQIPREGTKLRALYDLFNSNKGRVIDFSLGHERQLHDLRDYYGLDIIRMARGKWVLAGEWFGAEYRDYVAEHLASLEEQEAA